MRYNDSLVAGKQHTYQFSESTIGIHVLLSLMAVFLALLGYVLLDIQSITNLTAYFLFSFVVLAYSAAQARLVYVRERELILLNPAIHGAVLGNFMTFGVGNLLFFMPGEFQRLANFSVEVTYWMNYYLLLVILASIGLWSGYWTHWSRQLARSIQRWRFLQNVMRRRFKVQMPVVIVCLVASLVSRMIMISLGIYGYSSDLDRLLKAADYVQYLNMTADLGKLALLAIALQYFSKPKGHLSIGLIFLGITLYEVLFGLLSGFKSQVVMPVLVVAISCYAVRGRLPLWLAPAALSSLILAYAVIEPFREVRYTDQDFQSTDLFHLSEVMFAARDTVQAGDQENYSFLAGAAHFFGTRMAVPVYSRGIEYAVEESSLPAGSPAFLTDIALSPALAVVPRFAWPDKPRGIHGAWYAQAVMGMGPLSKTAVGMSAVTYLFFAGGAIAVFLGFFFFGIVQRGLFKGLLSFGGGGMLVFLSIFSTISGLDSVYYGFILGLIRFVPILIILQFMILKPTKVKAQRT